MSHRTHLATTIDSPAPLVREDDSPPERIPPDIFRAAMAIFLAGERLDMGRLAVDVGISRATLYRRVGGRDELLGEVVWYLTRRALIPELRRSTAARGAPRVLAVAEGFMRFVSEQPAFQRLLAEEPSAALRVLTSKRGPVQRRLIAVTESVLIEEQKRGALSLSLEPGVLAYLIVRIGESFLYADAIADNDLDLDAALGLIGQLLGASFAKPERAAA